MMPASHRWRAPPAWLASVVAITAGLAGAAHAGQQPTFRVSTLAVEINAAVSIGKRAAAGLTIDDFELTDNGVPQTLIDVSREKLPVDVTFVIDLSGSVGGLLPSLSDGAKRVHDRLRSNDRMSLITFNDQIRERMPLGAPAKISPAIFGTAHGFTALYDALIDALIVPPPVERRQMVLLFTDGSDTSSFLSDDLALDVARHSQAAVFAVLAGYGPDNAAAPFFSRVADATGGFVQQVTVSPFRVVVNGAPVDTSSDVTVDGSFVRAFDDFLSSYVLRYTVAGTPQAGWHDVAVRVKPSAGRGPFTVRARQGYFSQ